MALQNIVDLGALDGDIWLCGGPLSNFHATRAFADAVPADTSVICTGDTVGYCAHPAETVALIRDAAWHVVAGNCEREIAEGSSNCGCGFDEGSQCDLAAGAWFAHAAQGIDDETRTWMAGLPDAATFTQNGRRYVVIHGGAEVINRFLWPSDRDAVFEAEIATLTKALGPIDGVICGHSGVAFSRRIGEVHWLNAGALGMPPHDGRVQTRFAVLRDGEAFVHRLDYDANSASEAMVVVGLTQGYQSALVAGYWPSEDILPPQMRLTSSIASG